MKLTLKFCLFPVNGNKRTSIQLTLQNCMDYINIISGLSIVHRRPALSNIFHYILCWSKICYKCFLALGLSIAMRIAYHFGQMKAVKTHSQKCAITIVQWPVFYLLCLWYFFVECLQAPCPHPVLKSCPRVFSPGPLHPDPLHIYPGTTTDDSAVCCPVRHEPSVVHQVCLCIIYIIYMYTISMY